MITTWKYKLSNANWAKSALRQRYLAKAKRVQHKTLVKVRGLNLFLFLLAYV